ncbi:hypothetical protein HK102_009426, partial [Quaeritorhiza haematococci]
MISDVWALVDVEGNHAQGVALAAQKLGIQATIVMPKFAPQIKVDNVRRLGAKVVLSGNDFDEAKEECLRLQRENNLTFIHPFDDPYIIAGQGTVGVEILRQLQQDRIDAIFVCCGGGGLLAGIAAYVKRIRPEIRIIGVNTVDSDGMYQSLIQGTRTELKQAGLFSDGTSVRLVGAETFRLCQEHVDDFVLVTTDEICAAIKDCFEDTRSIVEPAGALALAGCKKWLASSNAAVGGEDGAPIKDGNFVVVLSGANMNFDRLRFVAERARLGEGKEALITAIIPERPGSLLELYKIIYPRTITEFSYRYSDPVKAFIYMAFEVANGKTEVDDVLQQLKAKKTAIAAESGSGGNVDAGSGESKRGGEIWDAVDISDNEMAKTHGRYLAGGRSATVHDEVLFRFQFPERPGALLKFLTMLEADWNLSLFHYRNHGADVARVLVGLQVPSEQRSSFKAFLDNLGYSYVEETENP